MSKLITVIITVFLIQLIGYALPNFKKSTNVFIGFVLSVVILSIGFLIVGNDISLFKYLLYCALPTGILSLMIGVSIKNNANNKNKELAWNEHEPFVLEHGKGTIKYYDAFDNFMLLAGANSGKTKSFGRPLLREYLKNDFAGFIFDYKDMDYTKTAYHLVNQVGYEKNFYYANFTDLSRSYRFNPIKPSVLGDKNLLPQLMTDLLTAYLSKDTKKDEWFDAGLGVLKAVSLRFYKDYEENCTIPHILLFLSMNARNTDTIVSFIEKDPQASTLAGGFLSATEKQRGAQLSSVTGPIGDLTSNENICYVLTGNDFDFNLVDPKDPKLFSISSSYRIEDQILPVISMMVKISSRNFDMENREKFFYFMDEGTTFRVHKFESMPSVLREYGVSFVLITQNEAKIVMTYDENTLRSLKANYGNMVFGKTLDPKSQQSFVQMFSKIDKKKESISKSKSDRNFSRGKSITIERKDKYETSEFARLKAGEFIGTSVNASKTEYHERFKMMDQPKEIELPIIRNVTKEMIEKNYNDIIEFVKLLE